VYTEKKETLQFILKVFGEENTCHLITHFNDLCKKNFHCTPNKSTMTKYIRISDGKSASAKHAGQNSFCFQATKDRRNGVQKNIWDKSNVQNCLCNLSMCKITLTVCKLTYYPYAMCKTKTNVRPCEKRDLRDG